jgi:hypothetical protein
MDARGITDTFPAEEPRLPPPPEGLKLATHLQTMSRLRMLAAVSPLPHISYIHGNSKI